MRARQESLVPRTLGLPARFGSSRGPRCGSDGIYHGLGGPPAHEVGRAIPLVGVGGPEALQGQRPGTIRGDPRVLIGEAVTDSEVALEGRESGIVGVDVRGGPDYLNATCTGPERCSDPEPQISILARRSLGAASEPTLVQSRIISYEDNGAVKGPEGQLESTELSSGDWRGSLL